MKHIRTQLGCLIVATVTLGSVSPARADAITDWNETLGLAIKSAGTTTGTQSRPVAIMHIAMFDAVNGIARKYEPFRVSTPAPAGARQEAAAVEAAYTTCIALYPAQTWRFDARLAETLAKIPGAHGNSESIARGRQWGRAVALAILAWRSTDGVGSIAPWYMGDPLTPGVWQPVPPNGTLAAVFPDFVAMPPYAMTSPQQFRPGPPPALHTPDYAAAVNEVKEIGKLGSTVRTTEQTTISRLWHAVDVVDENASIRALVSPEAELVDNARMFALVSVSVADSFIAGMDCKYWYNLWRPYHAIRLADTDNNLLTEPDITWAPLINTPRHQEYFSNHSVLTGATMRVMENLFGNNHSITIASAGFPSATKTYPTFSSASTEVGEARIWAGIHFRFSTDRGLQVGRQIADYVTGNFMRPVEEY
jgi:hypothetical protein